MYTHASKFRWSYYSLSHCNPVNPFKQAQEKLLPVTEQLPPCSHGDIEQGVTGKE